MSDASSTPVLALNTGSSSLKFGLHVVDAHSIRTLLSGSAEMAGDQVGPLIAQDADGNAIHCDAPPDARHAAIDRIAGLLAVQGLPKPTAIGHRIVHGGPACRRHA